MLKTDPGLGEALGVFRNHFTVVEATTDELRDRVYRLRYQVYCVEHPFEDAGQNLDGREIDMYDERSAHAALLHNESGELAGAVRLILPDPSDKTAGLPVFALSDRITEAFQVRAQAGQVAEISRYAISKNFRRRRFEELHADVGLLAGKEKRDSERRLMPFLTLGLIRAVYDLSRKHGVTHLVATMDPLLLRLMARMHIDFEPLGPLVDHHGMRQPCAAAISNLRQAFSEAWPDMYQLVDDRKAAAAGLSFVER